MFAAIGDDETRLAEERAAGLKAKVVRFSWREHYPEEAREDPDYLQGKKESIERLRTAGFAPILALGFHDTPPWVHQNYPNTHYVDQHGREYRGDTFAPDGTPIDNGDANLVFNEELRGLVSSWTEEVFSGLGTDFYAVRLGGGRHGALTYPPAEYEGRGNLYWSFDANARSGSPAPTGWNPGIPSPNGEAEEFLEWHLDSLVEYQNWQVRMVREAGYGGRAMMLYPSWGLRSGQAAAAAEDDLSGKSGAERNGEVQRGLDFERQVGALTDGEVVVTTTWLDANIDLSADDRDDPRYWSPARYLSSLAQEHPLNLQTYGENTEFGARDLSAMERSAYQMRRHGLTGMAWNREEDLYSGRRVSLEDYRRIIQDSRETDHE